MKNDIENSFQQKFKNFEMTPSEGLFDAIQAKIIKKKKRAIWMWSAAMLILAGAGFTLWPQSSHKYDNLSKTLVKSETEDPTKPQIVDKASDHPGSSNKTTVTYDTKKVIKTQAKYTEQHTAQKTKNSYFEQQTASNPLEKQVQNTISSLSSKDFTTQKTSDTKQQWAKLFNKIEKENQHSDATQNTLYLGTKKQTVDGQPSLLGSSKTRTQENALVSYEKRNQPSLASAEKNTYEQVASCTIAPFPTGKLVAISKWRIQASAGVGYASRIVSATTPQYVANRNSSEKNRVSYQLGLDVIYQFSPKWNVQSGVNYTQRNEHFWHEKKTYSTQSREVERSETIIHPILGEIERTYQETIIDSTAQYEETSAKNDFHKISIPLVLERSLFTSQKWTLLAKAGVLAGIYAKHQGMLLTSAYETQTYTSVPMRTTGIHQVVLGLGAQYHLTPRISLIAYPQATLQINSSTTSKAEFSQKDWGIFTHIGLRIGL